MQEKYEGICTALDKLIEDATNIDGEGNPKQVLDNVTLMFNFLDDKLKKDIEVKKA